MDHLNTAPGEPHVIPRRTIHGRLVGVYSAGEPKDLTCVAATVLTLALGGVPGARHFGFTRKSGAREPWYPRGTEIRSGREISIVSLEELAEAARRMDLPEIRPEWIGANLAVEGVPGLSFLPSGTRIFFAGDASVVVEAVNGPCRDAGRSIARHTGGPADFELLFPKAARGLRGVVASVERPGTVSAGTEIQVRIPEQRLYL